MTAVSPAARFLTWTLPRLIIESRAWRLTSRILGVTLKPFEMDVVDFVFTSLMVGSFGGILFSVGSSLRWWSGKQFLLALLLLVSLVPLAFIVKKAERKHWKTRGAEYSRFRSLLPKGLMEGYEVVKAWTDSPLPLHRKTLLAAAGIQIKNTTTPETLSLTDEDLAVMAALQERPSRPRWMEPAI